MAAVSDDAHGTIMNLTIRVAPGNGSVYIGIPPYSGADLQRSVVQAVHYGNVKNCDVYVEFGPYPGTGYVDGPSAGAAMASMSYILVNDLPVVHRPVITGAVSSSGSVLPVGGIYEKALVSAVSGADAFVSPKTNLYDYIMLKKVEEFYGLEIVVVGSVEEAVDYITGRKIPQGPSYPDFESTAKNISPYDGPALGGFESVAADIIDFENYTVSQLRQDTAEEWLVDYFEDSVDENSRLLSLGYAYTAANNAFLGYIDLSTIVFVYSGEPGYQEKFEEVSGCIAEIQRPEMNEENFEWVIGSDLRKAWAEEKMASSEIREEHLIEEEYAYYHEIMYADAWCRASKGLVDVGMARDGKKIDESAWKEIAEDYLNAANLTKHSPETEKRFAIASSLYEEGKYGAAIFDSIYVASMDLADMDLADMDEEDVGVAVDEMRLYKPKFLWANIYRSQAVYLIEQDSPEYETAYSLLLFSAFLDEAVGLMESGMIQAPAEQVQVTDWNQLLLISASFILFFFVLVYILPRIFRRSYEGKDSKAHRTNRRKGESGSKGRLRKAKGKPGKSRTAS